MLKLCVQLFTTLVVFFADFVEFIVKLPEREELSSWEPVVRKFDFYLDQLKHIDNFADFVSNLQK
jgi:hypothetical protein